MVSITRQYANAFQTLAMRDHEYPRDEVLHDYRKFREWWELYSKDPEIAANPYKKYQFSTRNV